MKNTLYIIALLASFILTACNETVVRPDRLQEPVKDLGLKTYDVSIMATMPDGSVVTALSVDEGYETSIAIIKPDGSNIMSEPFRATFGIERIYVNAEGEILVTSFTYDENYEYCYSLHKFDNQCNLVYEGLVQNGAVALFDNGNIACFQREMIESTGQECLVMKILDNNLTYIMEQDFNTDYAYSFEDKIVLTDIVTGDFCIYKTDGSYLCSGTVNSIVIDITNIDGYIYFTTRGDYPNYDEEAENYNEPWVIHKVDLNGNVIFSTNIDAYQLYGNYSIIDGMLITTGSFSTNHQKNEGYGLIYLINNENGKLIDTIFVDYTGCEVLPMHVAPDKKSGYNVYVLRQDNYDIDRAGFEGIFKGKLFIYHTDDLHKLDINTINQ